jgi:hypothetical protein
VASIIEVFGNCRVVESIASGPLTDVYRAIQEPLGRHVAIKALRPTIAPSSPFAAHLAREAELLAKLHHDNILELYDFVRTDAAMWLVLEYVDGFSLEAVLARGERLSPACAVAIGIEIATALAHAHDRNIIHRDLKPANVLVSRRGQIKLVDFGIAHDDRVPSSPEPLDSGSTFGTPAYMSPEQILGESIDGRTDIFSLGVVLYQLVAGVRPFDGPDTKTTAQRIRHSQPPSIADLPTGLSRALERVVLRCIEKLPGDRFNSARELVSALETVLRSETTAATADVIAGELARAKLIDAPAPTSRAERAPSLIEPGRLSLWPAVRGFSVLLMLVVAGGVVIRRQAHAAEEDNSGKTGPLELLPSKSGYLRVVARPWAEVVVDGQRIDITPFARAVPLAGGTHYVTLKHPKAADERRVIKVTPGETVMLDVTLAVRGASSADAGLERARDTDTEVDAGPATP